MFLKAALLASVVVIGVVGDQAPRYPAPPPPYGPPAYGPPPPAYPAPAPEYPEVPPKYNYNYGVEDDYSGAKFGHTESRDGYKTEGSYTVDLPDGRKQTVTYVDNGDGLVAEVTYEGEATYPEEQPKYQPQYPAPSYPAPSYPAPSYPAPPPPAPYSPPAPAPPAPTPAPYEEPAEEEA